MNKLMENAKHWSKCRTGVDTNVKKMYNTVQLGVEDWCLQRIILQKDLDESKIPKGKIIKTPINGVRSSGNQAKRGLRLTEMLAAKEYSFINQIVQNNIYADDCLSGENREELFLERVDQSELLLNQGYISLRRVTFSKRDPPSNLPADNCSVNVAGRK